jgi:hypothetical protein
MVEEHRDKRGYGRKKIKYSVLLSEFRCTDKTMSKEVTLFRHDMAHLYEDVHMQRKHEIKTYDKVCEMGVVINRC